MRKKKYQELSWRRYTSILFGGGKGENFNWKGPNLHFFGSRNRYEINPITCLLCLDFKRYDWMRLRNAARSIWKLRNNKGEFSRFVLSHLFLLCFEIGYVCRILLPNLRFQTLAYFALLYNMYVIRIREGEKSRVSM